MRISDQYQNMLSEVMDRLINRDREVTYCTTKLPMIVLWGKDLKVDAHLLFRVINNKPPPSIDLPAFLERSGDSWYKIEGVWTVADRLGSRWTFEKRPKFLNNDCHFVIWDSYGSGWKLRLGFGPTNGWC